MNGIGDNFAPQTWAALKKLDLDHNQGLSIKELKNLGSDQNQPFSDAALLAVGIAEQDLEAVKAAFTQKLVGADIAPNTVVFEIRQPHHIASEISGELAALAQEKLADGTYSKQDAIDVLNFAAVDGRVTTAEKAFLGGLTASKNAKALAALPSLDKESPFTVSFTFPTTASGLAKQIKKVQAKVTPEQIATWKDQGNVAALWDAVNDPKLVKANPALKGELLQAVLSLPGGIDLLSKAIRAPKSDFGKTWLPDLEKIASNVLADVSVSTQAATLLAKVAEGLCEDLKSRKSDLNHLTQEVLGTGDAPKPAQARKNVLPKLVQQLNAYHTELDTQLREVDRRLALLPNGAARNQLLTVRESLFIEKNRFALELTQTAIEAAQSETFKGYTVRMQGASRKDLFKLASEALTQAQSHLPPTSITGNAVALGLAELQQARDHFDLAWSVAEMRSGTRLAQMDQLNTCLAPLFTQMQAALAPAFSGEATLSDKALKQLVSNRNLAVLYLSSFADPKATFVALTGLPEAELAAALKSGKLAEVLSTQSGNGPLPKNWPAGVRELAQTNAKVLAPLLESALTFKAQGGTGNLSGIFRAIAAELMGYGNFQGMAADQLGVLGELVVDWRSDVQDRLVAAKGEIAGSELRKATDIQQGLDDTLTWAKPKALKETAKQADAIRPAIKKLDSHLNTVAQQLSGFSNALVLEPTSVERYRKQTQQLLESLLQTPFSGFDALWRSLPEYSVERDVLKALGDLVQVQANANELDIPNADPMWVWTTGNVEQITAKLEKALTQLPPDSPLHNTVAQSQQLIALIAAFNQSCEPKNTAVVANVSSLEAAYQQVQELAQADPNATFVVVDAGHEKGTSQGYHIQKLGAQAYEQLARSAKDTQTSIILVQRGDLKSSAALPILMANDKSILGLRLFKDHTTLIVNGELYACKGAAKKQANTVAAEVLLNMVMTRHQDTQKHYQKIQTGSEKSVESVALLAGAIDRMTYPQAVKALNDMFALPPDKAFDALMVSAFMTFVADYQKALQSKKSPPEALTETLQKHAGKAYLNEFFTTAGAAADRMVKLQQEQIQQAKDLLASKGNKNVGLETIPYGMLKANPDLLPKLAKVLNFQNIPDKPIKIPPYTQAEILAKFKSNENMKDGEAAFYTALLDGKTGDHLEMGAQIVGMVAATLTLQGALTAALRLGMGAVAAASAGSTLTAGVMGLHGIHVAQQTSEKVAADVGAGFKSPQDYQASLRAINVAENSVLYNVLTAPVMPFLGAATQGIQGMSGVSKATLALTTDIGQYVFDPDTIESFHKGDWTSLAIGFSMSTAFNLGGFVGGIKADKAATPYSGNFEAAIVGNQLHVKVDGDWHLATKQAGSNDQYAIKLNGKEATFDFKLPAKDTTFKVQTPQKMGVAAQKGDKPPFQDVTKAGSLNTSTAPKPSPTVTPKTTFIVDGRPGKNSKWITTQIETRKTDTLANKPQEWEQLQGILEKAATDVQRVFIYRAYGAGYDIKAIADFATAIKTLPDAKIVKDYTFATGLQSFLHSCVPTSIMVIRAQRDPLYAKMLQDSPVFFIAEQKLMLEKFDGSAKPRLGYSNSIFERFPMLQNQELGAFPTLKNNTSSGSTLTNSKILAELNEATHADYHLTVSNECATEMATQGVTGLTTFASGKDAIATMAAAAEAGYPVLFSHGGHARSLWAFVDIDGETKYAIHDPMSDLASAQSGSKVAPPSTNTDIFTREDLNLFANGLSGFYVPVEFSGK